MAEDLQEPGQPSRLGRLSTYDRPWVGRVGLGLGLMLWLLVTSAAFGAGLPNGLTVLILGGVIIFGEVWIERTGRRGSTFASAWHLSMRFAMGVVLVLLAVMRTDGWGTALLVVFGAWLIIPAIVLGGLLLRDVRETRSQL
jgi:hypothetical protein